MAWNGVTPIVPSNVKVAILIPHRDEQDYRQWDRWWLNELQKPPDSLYYESRGLSLTTNRTQLVRLALKTDASHFFFLDDDVIAPNDVIQSLLAANQPIVCGLYMAKKAKEKRGLSAWMKAGGGYAAISPEQKGRYVQVDVTGLGCCLLQRSVFEKVPEPWFVWEPEGPSEDFFFFEKVFKEIGVKPVIDMECKCRHIGVFSLDTDNQLDTLEI